MSENKTFTFIGAMVGLVLFLIIGLLPALVYGGYAGVMLANALYIGAIHTSLLAQTTVIFTVLAGVLSVASLFVISGAALGYIADLVTRDLGFRKDQKDELS
jgi:hypothetical protein